MRLDINSTVKQECVCVCVQCAVHLGSHLAPLKHCGVGLLHLITGWCENLCVCVFM